MSNVVPLPTSHSTDRAFGSPTGPFQGLVHDPVSDLEQMELVVDLLQAVHLGLAAIRVGIMHTNLLSRTTKDLMLPRDLPCVARPASTSELAEPAANTLPSSSRE